MSAPTTNPIQIQNYLGSIQLALDSSRDMERMILEGGVWSAEIVQLISMLVREGDYVLDVGANSGLITLPLALAVGAAGRVIAFEPDSTSIVCMRRNIALNSELAGRIVVEEIGLGSQPAELFVYHDTEGGNAYLSSAENPKYGQVETSAPQPCKIETLDRYLESNSSTLPHIDFIKIDVEGMEHLVLRGARDTLARCKPIVVFETLVRCFPEEDIRECESILRALGYHLFVKQPEGKLFPTSFPNLAEDTIAIHQDRLVRCVHAMINAVALRIDTGPLSAAKVWVAAVSPQMPVIRIDCPDAQVTCGAEMRNQSELVLTVSTAGDPVPHLYSIMLDQLTTGSLSPFARYSSAGSSLQQIPMQICEGEKLHYW